MGVARRLPSSTRFLNGRKRSLGLPKSRVAGSNPVARSTNPQVYQGDSHIPPVSRSFGKVPTTASRVASVYKQRVSGWEIDPEDEGGHVFRTMARTRRP